MKITKVTFILLMVGVFLAGTIVGAFLLEEVNRKGSANIIPPTSEGQETHGGISAIRDDSSLPDIADFWAYSGSDTDECKKDTVFPITLNQIAENSRIAAENDLNLFPTHVDQQSQSLLEKFQSTGFIDNLPADWDPINLKKFVHDYLKAQLGPLNEVLKRDTNKTAQDAYRALEAAFKKMSKHYSGAAKGVAADKFVNIAGDASYNVTAGPYEGANISVSLNGMAHIGGAGGPYIEGSYYLCRNQGGFGQGYRQSYLFGSGSVNVTLRIVSTRHGEIHIETGDVLTDSSVKLKSNFRF